MRPIRPLSIVVWWDWSFTCSRTLSLSFHGVVDLMEEPEDMVEDDLAHVLPKQKNKKKSQAAGKRKR